MSVDGRGYGYSIAWEENFRDTTREQTYFTIWSQDRDMSSSMIFFLIEISVVVRCIIEGEVIMDMSTGLVGPFFVWDIDQ